MGGSYGGYATLVGLTFTPDTFACGVDIVGPSNLVTLLAVDPAVLGADARAASRSASATTAPTTGRSSSRRARRSRTSTRIKKPLLIGQGANDPRVKQAESDQIVKAMQAKKHPGHVRALSRRGARFAWRRERDGLRRGADVGHRAVPRRRVHRWADFRRASAAGAGGRRAGTASRTRGCCTNRGVSGGGPVSRATPTTNAVPLPTAVQRLASNGCQPGPRRGRGAQRVRGRRPPSRASTRLRQSPSYCGEPGGPEHPSSDRSASERCSSVTAFATSSTV